MYTKSLDSLLDHYTKDDLKERLLKRGTRDKKTGCLVWNPYKRSPLSEVLKKQVYGELELKVSDSENRRVFAHRLMWFCHHEDPGDLVIRHLCNNRRCFEIKHILAGTQLENTHDIFLSKRNPRTKIHLTEAEILLIYREAQQTTSQKGALNSIANWWGIPNGMVSSIKNGFTGNYITRHIDLYY